MTDDTKTEHDDHDASVLPAREVMSLISPGATSVPGLGGLLGADPTAGTGAAPAAGTGDLASGAAQHAADGQHADQPSVSDHPQSVSTSDSDSASAKS